MAPRWLPRDRRPSLGKRKFAAAVAEAAAELRRIRRLFSFARPYRGLLAVSWLATAGYAAAGAGLVHMVEPIFDDVLIKQPQRLRRWRSPSSPCT